MEPIDVTIDVRIEAVAVGFPSHPLTDHYEYAWVVSYGGRHVDGRSPDRSGAVRAVLLEVERVVE